MASFTAILSAVSGLPVVDRSGITGYVAFYLEFARPTPHGISCAATMSAVPEGRPLNVACASNLG
jgi:hypothetical protein